MNSSGKKILLRQEQKSMEWMMYPVSTSCKVGDLMRKPFTDTLATTKTCLQLFEVHRLFGCGKDTACF